jgi:hypothetical protein
LAEEPQPTARTARTTTAIAAGAGVRRRIASETATVCAVDPDADYAAGVAGSLAWIHFERHGILLVSQRST